MPGQRHEPHHKICNLRYGTPGYRMNSYYKLEVARFYKRCINAMNWLMGACSHSDTFICIYIARQRDMSMKRSEMRMTRVEGAWISKNFIAYKQTLSCI